MRLSVRAKIGVLIGLVLIILLIQFQRFAASNNKELNLVYDMHKQTLESFYSSVMELEKERLRIFSYDYSFWDDMMRFVQTVDMNWAYDNLETTLSTYDADFAAVFGVDGKLLYFTSRDSSLKEPNKKSMVDFKVVDHWFAQYYLKVDDLYLEVWQAPIQPTNDNDRKTVPKGYFICGRLLSPSYLAKLSDLLDAKIAIQPFTNDWDDSKESLLSEGVIAYSQPLRDRDGTGIGRIVFKNKTNVLSAIWHSNHYEPFTFLIVAILIFFTYAYLFLRWFMRPIRELGLSIESPDSKLLDLYKEHTGEIGQLAGAIIRSHQQKEEIAEAGHRLETLLSSLPGMAYRCTNEPKWTMDFVSEGCLDVTGYEPKDLILNAVISFADLISEEDRPRVWETIQKAVHENRHFELTYRIRRKDGEERWVNERGIGFWDKNRKETILDGFIQDVTAQVKAEESVRKSEQQYRELVEKANNAILRVNSDGIITFANEPALKMFGYEKSELVGSAVKDKITAPDGAISNTMRNSLISDLMSSGTSSFIQSNVRKDGSKIWVAWSHSVVTNDANQVVGVMAIGSDVTAQKEAEELLKASEERFRLIFENAPDGFYIHDLNGIMLQANREAERLFGRSAEFLLGHSILDFAPNDERTHYALMEIITKGNAGKSYSSNDLRFKRGEGHAFDAEVNSIPLDLNGRLCILGMIRDITTRKQAEDVVRHSEQQFRAVVSQSSDGIILVDSDSGLLTKVNPSFLVLTGYKEFEALSLTLYDLVDEPGEVVAGMLAHSALTGHCDCGERKLIKANGSTVVVELRGDMIEFGKVRAVSVIIHDVTERREAENALRASEERYRLLFRSSPLGVLNYDKNLKLTDCNEQFAKTIGTTREMLTDFDISRIKDIRIQQAILAPFKGENGFYEGQYISTVSGQETYVALHTSPIKALNGETIGALGIVEDISLRTEAMAALTTSEERFRSLVSSMDDIVFTLDKNERFTGFYGKWVERFRLATDEMLGKSVVEVFGPIEGAIHERANKRALEGEIAVYESTLKQEEKEIPIQTSLSPIYSEDGEIVGLVGIGRDVSQLKQYELELRRHTDQLQALYDGARVLGSTLDLVIIYQKLHDIIRQVAPCDGLFISSYDNETRMIRCEYAWHEGALIDVDKLPLIPLEESGRGVQSEVIRSGQPLMIGDFQARVKTGKVNFFVDESGVTHTEVDNEAEVTRSAIIVPILFDSAIIGVIQVLSYHLNAYTEENLHLVESLTSHAAAAHKNGLLYRRAQEEIAERGRAEKLQAALWRIAQSAAEMSDESSLFVRIHEIIRDVIPAQNFYIALYDDETNLINYPFYVKERGKSPTSRKPRKGLTEYTLKRKEAYLWRSDQDDPSNGGEIEIEPYSPVVWLGVPLLEGDQTIGVMAVQHFTNPDAYGPRERQVLEFVGSEVARSISHLRASKALVESEAKYRSLIEKSEDGIYLVVEDKFEIYNQRFLEMLKISEQEISAPGFSMYELVAPESRPLIEERTAMIDRGELPPPRYEFAALRKDGSEIEVEVSVAQLMYRGRRATQGIVRDITGRRQLESQMRQTQKLEAIGRLAGGVAHDFNNLLTAIIGTSELLRRQVSSNPALADEVDQIIAAATRGSNLTQQLLAFSRSKPHQARPMLLSRSVDQIEKMLQRLITEDIKLRIKHVEGMPAVVADPTQIELALMNLVINARDAMPNGGEIIVETFVTHLDETFAASHAEVTPGNYCVLSVTDQGVGMSKEVLEHATEPFFTTKPVGQGTGLGLSTVHGIIKQSGGYFSLESELGHGTIAKIYLPQSSAVAETASIQSKEEPAKLTGSETILVVDDEDAVRSVTVRILQLQGYAVIQASDGIEALQLANEYPSHIDMLLSDMMMPRLGGIELATKLFEIRPEMQVLLMSGYSPKAYPTEGDTESNQFEFIQKPFRAAELAARVREILNKRTKA